ncbi:MAG: M23 family metallopeptidase [Alphaproteobacteria bacterium]|nr:M23 family metallopeptidase [Alphaproteobacteria bacterium]
MMRGISPFFVVAMSALLAACTQTPAQVVDNSREYYGRDASSSWAVRDNAASFRESGNEYSDAPAPNYDYSTSAAAPATDIAVEPMAAISVSELPATPSASQPPVPLVSSVASSSIAVSEPAPLSAEHQQELHEELRQEIQGQAPAPESQNTHTVQPGETLYGIARMYGVNVRELAQMNGSSNPADLKVKVGQRLTLPGRESPREMAASQPIPDTTPADVIMTTSAPVVTGTISSTDTAPSMAALSEAGKDGFLWPVQGQVISRFGAKQGGAYNDGVNISAAEGTPIHAADAGEVVYVGNELKGYGNLLIIRHKDGWMTAYAHTGDITVKRGDTVRKGQTVATVGATGSVTRPQLHFAVRKGKKSVDPLSVLS